MGGNDSIQKTIFVSVLLCLFCSVLVSGAAVLLKPIQTKNKELDMKTNILAAAGLLKEGSSVDELFKQIKPVVVDLEKGLVAEGVDAKTFDQYGSVKDPKFVYKISKKDDLGLIKVRSIYALIYVVLEGDEIKQLILPIHGKALWSTMYGFVALEKDTTTVKGFSFYSHGETPGLGGEVDNPNWKSQWPGKKIFNENFETAITVMKGKVDKSNPNAAYEIDGLSGSTLTSRGIHNLIRYWFGANGFGSFLENFRNGSVQL